jgi:serralysin
MARVARCSILIASLLLAASVQSVPAEAASIVTKLSPITYTAFDSHQETLIPWQGQRVTVLVQGGVSRSAAVMTSLISRLDSAWNYYATTTGRTPGIAHSLNGRVELAEVNTTCGAGCGYLGATGVEMQKTYFENMYKQVANANQYDQTPFYEFGRNYWFWSDALQFKSSSDPVVTGFAVWMRFRSMSAGGVTGAPFNGTPFNTFRSQVAHLVTQYEADTSLTFAGTLGSGHSPGLYGGTDFWASIMMQLASRHGNQIFVNRFWHKASSLPAASSTAGAVTNWLTAANYASCVNLTAVFYGRWGFPHPDGTVSARQQAGAVPEPVGHC